MLKVSVILPNFNYARYLPRRIESILSQTYHNIELIILDDASSDNSSDIIQQYSHADKRILTSFSKSNSGNPFKQWEKGINMAKGEYIWIAEADDWCEPTMLENLIQPFNQQDVCISFCQSKIVDAQDQMQGTWKYSTQSIESMFTHSQIFDGKLLIEKALIYENVLPNASGIIFRKSTYNMVGGVNTELRTNADWLLWLKMAMLGNIAFNSYPYNFFRRHAQSVIASICHSHICYTEQYDATMRNLFLKFLKTSGFTLPVATKRVNKKYILYDTGNLALHNITHGKKWTGFILLLKTSLKLKSLGYIRKAYKIFYNQ